MTGHRAEGNRNMQVAIIAGGLGTRLGSLTKDKPKSLVKILSKPFLEYQVEFLRKGGIKGVVLCLGHLGELVKDYFGDGSNFGVSIKYSCEDGPLGTAGALKRATSLLGDVFWTIYGDSYLFLDYNRIHGYFMSQDKLSLMTVYKNFDQFDRSNTAVDDNMVRLYNKTNRTEEMICIDYGACLFRKGVLDLIPDSGFYSMEQLFTQLISAREMLAYEVKERFYEIGSPQGFKEFTKYIKDRK